MRSGAARLEKMLAAKQQGRLDGFFKAVPKAAGSDTKKNGGGTGNKRKVRDHFGPGISILTC